MLEVAHRLGEPVEDAPTFGRGLQPDKLKTDRCPPLIGSLPMADQRVNNE